jgi:glycosyltransferase involved in cell wall biosynthesis
VKILFIHNKYKHYGGEDVALELESSVLLEKGHEVNTLSFDNKHIVGFFSKIGAAFQAVYSFSSARKTSNTILQFKPDIIHIHNLFFIASPSIIYAARKHKIPVVLTLNNYRLLCANSLLMRDNEVCELCIHKKFPFHGIRYKCYRGSSAESALVTTITGFHKLISTWKNKVSAFIALNDFSRSKFLNSSLQIPVGKIMAKSNFVRDPGEGNKIREDFFLFVGRIAKEKGVHVLAKAFAAMPDNKIIIIGDGPEKISLQEKFRSYKNISFTGQMEKQLVKEYMKQCKAFICPSIWYEGTPLTIIEAFAAGTPVITSRLGSMAETVSDGFNGLLFTVGDADDLAKKVSIFLKETRNSAMFYENARQTYLEKYHEDVHYSAILKIYKSAIAQNND